MNIWSVMGMSVTFVAIFCVLMLEVFQDKGYYESYKWYFCGLLIGSGLILWLVSKTLRSKKKAGEPENNSTSEATSSPQVEASQDPDSPKDTGPFFLFTPLYWGSMLVTFGIIVIFIVPSNSAKKVAARSATNVVQKVKVAAAPVSTNVEAKPEPVAPPKFPVLKIQGIIYRVGNPSVVINGKAYFVGDWVDEAQVVAIERETMTLEMQGQKKTLVLEK